MGLVFHYLICLFICFSNEAHSAFGEFSKMKYILLYLIQQYGKNIEKKRITRILTYANALVPATYICILVAPSIFITKIIIRMQNSDKSQMLSSRKKKKQNI